jgi:hypothetical protein
MSEPVTISIKSVVGDNEWAPFGLAAKLLQDNLSTAVGETISVHCQFEPSVESLNGVDKGTIVIVSMLPEVANFREPWTSVEARWRERCRALMSADGAVVFLCTVFRWVPFDDAAASSRLKRIRCLNLMAAELSRETGVFVIDLDRDLADIGAVQLQTDYRLGGQRVVDFVASSIALAVVSMGLSEDIPLDIQEVAKLAIAEARPSPGGDVMTEVKPSNVIAMGGGRRKQIVASVVDTNSERHVGRLFRLLFTGKFSFGEALAKLRGSIARRGLWSSSLMMFAAIRHAMRGR